MIARTPDLRRRYDDRAKAELDRYSFEKDARREALAEGRAEGLAEGLAEGIAKGRAEGESRGLLKGRVELLQRLLEIEPTHDATINAMTLDELAQLADDLEQQFGRRN